MSTYTTHLPAVSLHDNRYDFSILLKGNYYCGEEGRASTFMFYPKDLKGMLPSSQTVRAQLSYLKKDMEQKLQAPLEAAVLAMPFPTIRRAVRYRRAARAEGISFARVLSSSQAAVMGLASQGLLNDCPENTILVLDGFSDGVEATLAVIEHDIVEILGTVGVPYSNREPLSVFLSLWGKVRDFCPDLPSRLPIFYSVTFPRSSAMLAALIQAAGLLSKECPLKSFRDDIPCLGAACQAGIITGQHTGSPSLLLHILSWDLTLYQANGDSVPLLEAQSTIPIRKSVTLKASEAVNSHGFLNFLFRETAFCETTPVSLSVPIYEIWDGKDAETMFHITADVEADGFPSLAIRNQSSGKEIILRGDELFASLDAEVDEGAGSKSYSQESEVQAKKVLSADRDFLRHPLPFKMTEKQRVKWEKGL